MKKNARYWCRRLLQAQTYKGPWDDELQSIKAATEPATLDVSQTLRRIRFLRATADDIEPSHFPEAPDRTQPAAIHR